MPAFPWAGKGPVEPDRTYVVMASRLPLRRSRSVPGFLRDTFAIRRQLAAADGLVGYALDANLRRRTFWTFSVWIDEDNLHAFATSDPHRQIIARLRPLMAETRFSTSTMTGSAIPSTWQQRKALVA
jgi:quinol monooxygenase YgiN